MKILVLVSDRYYKSRWPQKQELRRQKTKKSEKVMDLKQLVYDFHVEEADGCPFFYLKVSTGSVDNVKPELLLEAFYRYLELPYNEMQFQIHRVDVYARKEDGTLFALDEMGDDILE